MQHSYSTKKHLLQIASLSDSDVADIFDITDKIVAGNNQHLLEGCMVVNLFFESSTRTLLSFEVAAKLLGATVVTLPISVSAVNKGESLLDTARTVNAMHPDFIVIRHKCSGAASLIASEVKCQVINAGDGSNQHPTQALLDAYTILQFKKRITALNVIICGDILHSRVARSNIELLTRLGAKIHLVSPPSLMPRSLPKAVKCSYLLDNLHISECDVLMLLRLQNERMTGSYIPSACEYAYLYGIDQFKLQSAKPDILIMHPGPINRGIEIASEVADHHSAILDQVQFGVSVRQAVFAWLFSANTTN